VAPGNIGPQATTKEKTNPYHAPTLATQGVKLEIRKFVAPALVLLLLASVGAGIWYSNTRLGADSEVRSGQQNQITVRGLIGSEKEVFFSDPRVQKALAAQGLTVKVEKAGSRAIAERFDASQYDFGFPSGSPAAAQLRRQAKASNVFDTFYTPMVLASWRPIADILLANGIAERQGDIYYVTDMPGLMSLINKEVRWRDLKKSQAFSTGKSLLVNSTDVRTSNSAASKSFKARKTLTVCCPWSPLCS
jgi:hypothetical protein